jgi:signal transduction histidine kinase
MKVSDNGIGFDTASPRMNNGLKNMNERAKGHNWNLDIISQLGAGATITLKAEIA